MVFAESAGSGFINRSLVGFLLRLVDFRSKLVFGTPHFTHNIYYPVIWVCISELVGGVCDLYHIVLRWTRWYHARLYKLTDQFAPRSKYARLNPEPFFSIIVMKVEATEAAL